MSVNIFFGIIGLIIASCTVSWATQRFNFVGNTPEDNGIVYWAIGIPTIAFEITSMCEDSETYTIQIDGDNARLFSATLLVDNNCATCSLTTSVQSTAVNSGCTKTQSQFSYRSEMTDLSAILSSFNVTVNNGTSEQVLRSIFRNCSYAELSKNFTATTTPIEENYKYSEVLTLSCLDTSCLNGNSTGEAECSVNGKWTVTELDCDTECATTEATIIQTTINSTSNTTVSVSTVDMKRVIAVTVATNVIMVTSCCLMIFCFRCKRNDKEEEESREPSMVISE